MTKRFRIKDQSAVLSQEKARFLGFLAGDGGVYGEAQGYKGGSVHCYPGVDREMAEICVDWFRSLYGAKATITDMPPGKSRRKQTSFDVGCFSKEVADDVVTWGKFGIDDWCVPDAVLSGSPSVQGAWLSGWFEAEGSTFLTVKNGTRRVSSMTTNLKGLRQVISLLKGLGIRVGTTTREANPEKNTQKARQVNITDRDSIERYVVWAGFSAPGKRTTMAQVVLSYAHDEDSVFDSLLNSRLSGASVEEAAVKASLDGEDGVHAFMDERASRGHRRNGDDKIRGRLPKIRACRETGLTWLETGKSVGYVGTDHQITSAVQGAVAWAKRKGLYPPS